MTEALKIIHIATIALWAAGLLCLPGLYVQRAHVSDDDALHRLHAMVRFAYITLISPAAFLAIGSGIALIFVQQTFQPWFGAKLALVAVLAFIHVLTGLVVIRLFREGETYPVWRFIMVTVLVGAVILGILWLVLAKPMLPDLPKDIFAPGALQGLIAPLNPWATP